LSIWVADAFKTGTVPGSDTALNVRVAADNVVRVTGTVDLAAGAIAISIGSASFGSEVQQGASGSVPWKVTGSVGITAPVSIGNTVQVTGALKITEVVAVSGSNQFPTAPLATQYIPVRLTDGSSFYVSTGSGGGAGVGGSITGSVALSEAPQVLQGTSPWTVAGTVTAAQGVSGSTSWKVTGSVGITEPVQVSNIVQVTGGLKITELAQITGSVSLASAPQVLQGTSPWTVGGTVPPIKALAVRLSGRRLEAWL
jgi:hypothetical protein